MGKYRIICSKCGHVVKDEPAYKCPACGGILEFKYDVPKQFGERTAGAHGVFKYLDVLPVSGDMPVTLGEGGTPLVESVRLAEEFGLDRLFFKLEFVNPTGSFKDRGMAVLFTKAAELGMKKAVVASSGNAAASAAAYAARSGVELVAVVPENTPEGKTVQMETHGGKVLKVPGLFGNSYTLCKGLAEKNGWFNLTTTFLNPYAREGYKTASYEIFEQLGHATPDIVVVPNQARSHGTLESILLQGIPGYFYMDRSYLDRIRQVDGEKVSLITYLAELLLFPIPCVRATNYLPERGVSASPFDFSTFSIPTAEMGQSVIPLS